MVAKRIAEVWWWLPADNCDTATDSISKSNGYGCSGGGGQGNRGA